MYGQPGAPSYVPPSGSTAKTLILVGIILQAIFVLIYLLIGAVSLIVTIFGAVYLVLAVLGIVWLLLIWLFSYSRVREGRYEAARVPTLIFGILSLLQIIPGILYIIAYVKLGDAVREQQMPPPGYPGGAPMMAAQPYPGAAPMVPQAGPYAAQPSPMGPQATPYAAQPAPMAPQTAPYAAQPAPMGPGAVAPAPVAMPPAPAAPAAVICPRCGRPATFIPQYNRYYCYTDQQYV